MKNYLKNYNINIKVIFFFCSTVYVNALYFNKIESDFSINYYLYEYIEYNLQMMNITSDEEIKKEINKLIEYLSKFNSNKCKKIL